MSSQAKLYLGRADHGAPLSHTEFAEADFEEPLWYERVDGRLVVMPPAGHDHCVTGEPFRDHLGAYKLTHPELVEFVVSEAWIVIDEETERIADIGVYLHGKQSGLRIPRRVPEAVFEMVSEGAQDRERDYKEKRAEYRRLGVQEYVVVDRFERQVTVFRLHGNRYRKTILGPEDVYTTPLLPDLEIPLGAIL